MIKLDRPVMTPEDITRTEPGVVAWYLHPQDWEGPDGGPAIPEWIAERDDVVAVAYGDDFTACVTAEAPLWPDMLIVPDGSTKPPLHARYERHWGVIQRYLSLGEVPQSVRLPKGAPVRAGELMDERVCARLEPFIRAAVKRQAARRATLREGR